MTVLNITLNPHAVNRVHDALVCLSKFGEYITLEALRNKFNLVTLNSTHSAHVKISISGDSFCDAYNFVPAEGVTASTGGGGVGGGLSSTTASSSSQGSGGKGGTTGMGFACRFNVKALLPVFRGRQGPDLTAKDRDDTPAIPSVEKCEISLHEHGNKGECRLVIQMYCKHGIIKTWRLQYEESESTVAIFDKQGAENKWKIRASLLKEYMEHFGPKTEYLDIAAEEGRASFTSFTEKIVDGSQILKHPLQTSIALDIIEFADFSALEGHHVAINVKDFKAIVTHADTLEEAYLNAYYGDAGRPLQVAYEQAGMGCEFTLMTRRKGLSGVGSVSGRSEPLARVATKTGPVLLSRAGSASRAGSVAAAPAASTVPAPALTSSSKNMPPPPPQIPNTPRLARAPTSTSTISANNNKKNGTTPTKLGSFPGNPASQHRQQVRESAIMASIKQQSQGLFFDDDDEEEDNLFGNTPEDGKSKGDDDDDDVLGWDAGLERVSFIELERKVSTNQTSSSASKRTEEEDEGSVIGPTQMSGKVLGIFD